MKTATHPRTGDVIRFDPEHHVYSTAAVPNFTSVTTFVKHFFPKFDAHDTAERCARKRGSSTQSLLAEWEAKRLESSLCGTRTHETCEAMLKGEPPPHQPRHDRERLLFAAGYDAVSILHSQGFQFHAAEQIVFSEKWRIAGTVDLLMYHPASAVAWILDWKTNEAITWDNRWSLAPRLIPGNDVRNPLALMADCNALHYSLQLSLYQYLMVSEGYISPHCRIERALIHLTPSGPEWIPVPYLQQEIQNMLPAFWECPF